MVSKRLSSKQHGHIKYWTLKISLDLFLPCVSGYLFNFEIFNYLNIWYSILYDFKNISYFDLFNLIDRTCQKLDLMEVL